MKSIGGDSLVIYVEISSENTQAIHIDDLHVQLEEMTLANGTKIKVGADHKRKVVVICDAPTGDED